MQPDDVRNVDRSRATPISRRGFLLLGISTSTLLLLNACGEGATSPSAQKPVARPADARQPAATTAPAAPAAAAQPTQPAAAAKPAEAPKPAAATQAAPAAKASTPNLKGTSLSVLLSAGFVPESDPFFKKQV